MSIPIFFFVMLSQSDLSNLSLGVTNGPPNDLRCNMSFHRIFGMLSRLHLSIEVILGSFGDSKSNLPSAKKILQLPKADLLTSYVFRLV